MMVPSTICQSVIIYSLIQFSVFNLCLRLSLKFEFELFCLKNKWQLLICYSMDSYLIHTVIAQRNHTDFCVCVHWTFHTRTKAGLN